MLNSPIFSAKHSISVYFRLRFYQMRSIRLFLHKSYDTAQLLRNFSPLNMETVHTNTVSATNRIHNYSEEAIASNQYLIERSRSFRSSTIQFVYSSYTLLHYYCFDDTNIFQRTIFGIGLYRLNFLDNIHTA